MLSLRITLASIPTVRGKSIDIEKGLSDNGTEQIY